ncbi:Uncharacterised protein [Chlamydia trachomatis]|nr:Uncharacterised protein [Chlamydia trachomatis]CRH92317.1 Uncharacterised protein [Chlamydia trachomatis]
MKNLKPVLKEIFDFTSHLFFYLIAIDISFQFILGKTLATMTQTVWSWIFAIALFTSVIRTSYREFKKKSA